MILSNECWLKDKCNKNLRSHCADGAFCVKLFKLDTLYNNSLLSKNQRNKINLYIDADGTDRDAFKALKEIEQNIIDFVKNGENIYIYSTTCGNGKSSWAIRLIQSYFDRCWPYADLGCSALFINVPRFFLCLKDNINGPNEYAEHIKKYVLEAPLVVWDDIATKSLTSYEHEHLLNLIDTRLAKGLSNIYTSNISDDNLQEKVGDRLASRIVNKSTCIEFFGKDKRGLK